jgi:hypothetical protein
MCFTPDTNRQILGIVCCNKQTGITHLMRERLHIWKIANIIQRNVLT